MCTASISTLLQAEGIEVVPIRGSLVDAVWTDQPPRSDAFLDLHPMEFAGQQSPSFQLSGRLTTEGRPSSTGVSSADKLASLSKEFGSSSQLEGFFSQTLDEIAWLLNLRSHSDIPFNPVFPAYL